MKRLLILLVIINIFLSGCGSKEESRAQEKLEGNVEEEIIYVKLQTIGTRDFAKTLSLSAILEPQEKVKISSKINGTIEDIFVDIGSRVEKDQMLCKLDDTIYSIEFKRAGTGVRDSMNSLSRLRDFDESKGMKNQGIEVAQSQYEKAKINYDNMEKSYNRIVRLYEEKGISQSDYEAIRERLDLAKKQYDLASANLSQAKRDWKYNVEAAEIGLEAARNNYKLAKESLAYTNIVAPISGVVAKKNVLIGESVGMGSDIFTIVNTDNIYANSGVSEKDVVKLMENQQVFIKVNSLGNKTIEGKLIAISPIIDEASKTYPIKALVENINNELRGGMFATLEIVIDSNSHSLAVPKDGVIKEDGEYYVFIDKDGQAQKRLVKLGYSDEDYYEILEGVKKGEKLIKSFNDKLEHGSSIKSN